MASIFEARSRETCIRLLLYLQDGLEAPCWDMMVDNFVRSNYVNDQSTHDAAPSVVNDKRRELKLRIQQAKRDVEQGTQRRLRVLDTLLVQTSDEYESLREQQVQALQPLILSKSTQPR